MAGNSITEAIKNDPISVLGGGGKGRTKDVSTLIVPVLEKVQNEWLDKLRRLAPVDKGTFRAGWQASGVSHQGGEYTFTIENPVPYAEVLEGGVIPGNKPWPRPTKKVVEFEGLLWSKKAPGGTIRKVLGNQPKYIFVDRVAHRLAREVLYAIENGYYGI